MIRTSRLGGRGKMPVTTRSLASFLASLCVRHAPWKYREIHCKVLLSGTILPAPGPDILNLGTCHDHLVRDLDLRLLATRHAQTGARQGSLRRHRLLVRSERAELGARRYRLRAEE